MDKKDLSKMTKNKLIMSAKEQMIEWDVLKPAIEQLQHYALKSDQKKIRDLLLLIVPEFNPQSEIKDLLYEKNK